MRIYFDGPGGSVAPGSTLSIGVYVDAKAPINAFDLSMIFPVDQFEFLGSDNTGSIVDIWQTKPSLDTKGNVNFSGGILDPYTGTKGLLAKFSFKVLENQNEVDVNPIDFSKSDFFISDGQGTKIVAEVSPFTISVKQDAEVVSVPFVPFQPTPSDILIEEGVQDIKKEVSQENTLIFSVIFAVLFFVILVWTVYNKRKQKL
jgi:hypothetical protein